jgi:hypothetical protein
MRHRATTFDRGGSMRSRPTFALASALAAALSGCDRAAPPTETPDAAPDGAAIASLTTPAGFGSLAPPATCPYDEATGWHVCPATTQNGVTVATMVRYLDARGAPQRAMDASTVAHLVRATLRGTLSTAPTGSRSTA